MLIRLLLLLVLSQQLSAQVCKKETVWQTSFENGKPHERVLYKENLVCTDSKGNTVRSREYENWELQYQESFFDQHNRLIKHYYRHGYESNDGGEGTVLYFYKNDTTKEIGTTANYSYQKITFSQKVANGTVKHHVSSYKSDVLENYNHKTQGYTQTILTPTDSLVTVYNQHIEAAYSTVSEITKKFQKGLLIREIQLEKHISNEQDTTQNWWLTHYSYTPSGKLLHSVRADSSLNPDSEYQIVNYQDYYYQDTFLIASHNCSFYQHSGQVFYDSRKNFVYDSGGRLILQRDSVGREQTLNVTTTAYQNGQITRKEWANYELQADQFVRQNSSAEYYQYDSLSRLVRREEELIYYTEGNTDQIVSVMTVCHENGADGELIVTENDTYTYLYQGQPPNQSTRKVVHTYQNNQLQKTQTFGETGNLEHLIEYEYTEEPY